MSPLVPSEPPRSRRPSGTDAFGWIVLVSGWFWALGCGAPDVAPPRPEVTEPAPVEVEIAVARFEPWRHTLRHVGVIRAAAEVTVSVERSGRVAAVLVREGDAVARGDVLLRLEGARSTLSLRRAEEATAVARVEVEESKRRLARQSELHARGAVSDAGLEEATAAAERADASLRSALAAEAIADRDLREGIVRSPVDGRVQSRRVEPGELPQIGAPLLVLEDRSRLDVAIWVSERDIHLLHPGQPAQIHHPSSGPPISGMVGPIGTKSDPSTGNFEVELALDDAAGLLPGMTVDVVLQIPDARPRIQVPRHAIVDRERHHVAFVVEGNTARRRDVSLVPGESPVVALREGLAEGDRVVIRGAERLREGTPIVIVASFDGTDPEAP